MNAVIYARYSCDNQREESIEGQLRECMAFAERKGYDIVHTYADRAMSGKKADNRPEFQQMISDSKSGGFEYIIVWKIDRFSRDKFDSVMYKAQLKKNGVRVISATEPIDDSPEGRLMESIFEGFSEYYSKDLEQKVSRGMTENTINGKFNGGTVTFGYAIDNNGNFYIDPLTGPIVTDIFERYANGEPIRSIIDDLNSKGIRNNRGKPITYHAVNWMLKNRRYIGEYSFKDVLNNDAIPPLVTKELFERCRNRLTANTHKSGNFRPVEERYLLTGKIFCGYCNDTMSGISGTGRTNTKYRYYQCMTSKKKQCAKKTITKNVIENGVLQLTMQIFDDKDLVKRISNSCYKLQSAESPQLPILKQKLCQTEKEIDNLMNAIKSGLITKSTKATLEKLEEEQEKLTLEIAKEKMLRPAISKEQIEAWIMKFAKTDLNDEEQKRKLIDTFVNSVQVYDDRVVVLFNYKDGEKSFLLNDSEAALVYDGKDCIQKENTHDCECSSLFKSGDPYGN